MKTLDISNFTYFDKGNLLKSFKSMKESKLWLKQGVKSTKPKLTNLKIVLIATNPKPTLALCYYC